MKRRRMMTKRMTRMKVKVRMRKTTTSPKKTSKNPDLAVARRKRSTRKTRSTSATRKTRSVDTRTRAVAKRRTKSADARRKTLARTAMPQPHVPLLPPLSQPASQSLKPPSQPTTVRRTCFPLRRQPTKTIFCSNNFCKERELSEPSLKVTMKMSKCFTGGSRISCILRGK
jgi:hypothetical protein